MKTIVFITAIAAMLLSVTSCNSNDKSGKAVEENSPANTDDKQKTTTASVNIPNDMKDILGEWTLIKKLRDDNGNHKIDGDEEKTAMQGVKNYMKLNADGTCKFETVMDGKYEIVTTDDGRKKLALQDMTGTKYPMRLYIISVNENELVINVIAGGSGFEVYKRP
jgi:restriction endonuclease S subunit